MTRIARLALLMLCAAALMPPGLRAADQDGFSICVLIGGAPAPEYASRGRIYIEALQGREFSIRLSNPTSERVAAALSVDGRNVVDARRTTASSAAKWILMPGQTVDIPGWQVSGETSRRFFFTQTSHSYAKWLGDTSNVGTIEAVFYREKRRPPVIARKDERAAGNAGEMAQAPASLPDSEGAGEAPPQETSKKARAKESDRFAATGIGDRTDFRVQWVSFDEESTPAARISLRYEFRPELLRLGVLVREEDLFARDRARGFEHEYAPDPYRPR